MKTIKNLLIMIVSSIIITSLFISCNTSNEVANSNTIEKRKYTKGYFVKSLAKNDQITGENKIADKKEEQQKKLEVNKKLKKNTIINELLKEYISDYGIKDENNDVATGLIASNSNIPSEIIIKKVKKYIQLKNKTTKNDNKTENYNINENEGCDQLILKNGDTLLVDIKGVAINVIQYLKCDSLEPVYNISKSEVLAIKYSHKQGIFYNNETYGATNTNNFGYIDYKNSNYPEKNKQARTGLILGVIGLFVAGIILGLLAIIFSAIGLGKINKNPELYSGKGMAIGGIILGIIDIVGLILVVVLLL